MPEKRDAGQFKDGVWLVLAESTGKEGVGYVHGCGTKIRGQSVSHPIWDGPGPCSGGGSCQEVAVPYCPKCETTPNPSGTPIIPEGSR